MLEGIISVSIFSDAASIAISGAYMKTPPPAPQQVEYFPLSSEFTTFSPGIFSKIFLVESY
ncbi:MAG: hypothetical protein DRN04_06155 [Thermoprotei archaeon]|nr:MAG: hypothetical protein DRN04_06155 [Thermoprotei archaeon]